MNQQPYTNHILAAIFSELQAYYGTPKWWPTHSGGRWEIMLGVVLTQRTTWSNVETALNNVLSFWGPDGLTKPEMVLEAQPETLEALFRPAGHYTTKPRRVRELAKFIVSEGGIDALARSTESTESLRERLLTVWGIGPETADAILLYALDRTLFVADAYALRLASRWGLIEPNADYNAVQALFTQHLPGNAAHYNEMHALVVSHAKELCRARPKCELCPLNSYLPPGDGLEADIKWRCPKLYTKNQV